MKVLENLTIGIIGVGRIGRLHIENLIRFPQVKIKTISDIFIDDVKKWAQPIGIEHVTTDYHEIIADPHIQAVFICSPTTTHAQIIKESALAGKAIFCEKPLSFSVAETEEVLNVVKETGVKLQIGFNRRFDHSFQKVKETVEKGIIGETHLLKITSRDPEPPGKDYIKNSGGMFMDMSIHDFDMARYLIDSEVEEVYVQGASLIDPIFKELWDVDTAIIVLKFANGTIGVIDNSRKAVYGYDQRVEVFGSKGAVSFENDLPTRAVISTADGVISEKPKYFFLERYEEAYVKEIQSFLEVVMENKDIICNGNDGLQAEYIAKAAKLSLETGQPLKVKDVVEI